MSTTAVELVDLNFCHVHGTSHPSDQDWAMCHQETWPGVIVGEVLQNLNPDESPEDDATPLILCAGDLAYIDTMQAGLVPCKVLFIDREGAASVRITAYREGWRQGDTVPLLNPRLSLVKREQVSTRGGTTTIRRERFMLATEEGLI